MKLLKLIGVLMDYPQDELWQHREELIAAANNPQLSKQRQAECKEFVRILLNTDPFAAQSAWLSTFERGRTMSLLLFEHIHGESRDRGQAMVDLIDTYRNHGFELAAKELPDYLPLLLEYLSHRPSDEARDWLGHIKHIVAMLAARAGERRSSYTILFEILVELAAGNLDVSVLRRRASEEPRDDTAEIMDRLWEEEAVRFGAEPPADDCSPGGHSPARAIGPGQVQP